MEGSFYQLLKDIVIKELEKEGYDLYIEPFKIPLDGLMWNYFRPDILGIMHEQTLFFLLNAKRTPREGALRERRQISLNLSHIKND